MKLIKCSDKKPIFGKMVLIRETIESRINIITGEKYFEDSYEWHQAYRTYLGHKPHEFYMTISEKKIPASHVELWVELPEIPDEVD